MLIDLNSNTTIDQSQSLARKQLLNYKSRTIAVGAGSSHIANNSELLIPPSHQQPSEYH